MLILNLSTFLSRLKLVCWAMDTCKEEGSLCFSACKYPECPKIWITTSEVWCLRYDVWGMTLKYDIWHMTSEVWRLKYDIWSMTSEIWQLKYDVIWRQKYDVCNITFEVWRLKYDVWSMTSEIWRLKYDVRSVKYGVISVKSEDI